MSTLKASGQARLTANPKLPPHEPWWTVVEASKPRDFSSNTSANAFTGFCERPLPGSIRVGVGYKGLEGRRRGPIVATDVALRSIILDDAAELSNVLPGIRKLGWLNLKVSGGSEAHASPFSYGTSALWSMREFEKVLEDVKAEVKQGAARRRRHYLDTDWKKIEKYAFSIINHTDVPRNVDPVQCAQMGQYVLPQIVVGDSLLHIALRAHSITAASALVQRGVDATAVNRAGDGPPDLLPTVLDRLIKQCERIVGLKTRFNSQYLADLDGKEYEELEREEEFNAKWRAYRRLCSKLLAVYEERIKEIKRLEHKQWLEKLEGEPFIEEDTVIISTRPRIDRYLSVCAGLVDASQDDRRPGFESTIAIPPDVEDELKTLSTLSFYDDRVRLDRWLLSLERSTVSLQACWRGYKVRSLIRELVSQRAVVFIQAASRAYLARVRVTAIRWHRNAIRIQCFVRCIFAKCKVVALRFEREWRGMERADRESRQARSREQGEEDDDAEPSGPPKPTKTMWQKALGLKTLDELQDVQQSLPQLKASGDTKRLKKAMRQVLQAQRRELGKYHPDTAATMNDLAVATKASGSKRGAKKLYKKALVAKARTLGTNHPSTAITKCNLANLHFERKQFVQAQDLYDESIPALEQGLGKTHILVAKAKFHSALSKYHRGLVADALDLLHDAIPVFRRDFGVDDPRTQKAQRIFGKLKVERGNR